MRAVYKKEVRGYLTSMTGYIVMAVILAVTSLYFSADCLISMYPVFGVVLSSVYFVLLIVVPVLTMRSMAEEKRQKTDQLLLTAPVAVWKVVTGKFLAMLTIFAIPMLVICLYPLLMSLFGSVSLPMAYTSIAGYTLYGAACLAIGLFLSAVTESQVIAAVLTFGVLFLLNMSSSIASLLGFDGVIGSIFDAVCIYQPFVNFVQGIFDLTGVVYYVGVIVLFIFLTIQLLYKKHGGYRAWMSVIAVAAVVLVNLIAAKLPSQYMKFDVSEQKLFTVGEQTEEVLSALDEDIDIYLIAQDGDEDQTLLELLGRYEGLSSHISVSTVDPVLYPSFVSQYTDESLTENSILVVGQERSKAVDYYDIYEYSYDYYSYSSELTAFDGEGQITSAIDYVTAEDIPVIYTLTGHDEATFGSTLSESIDKENIEVQELSLLTSEAVPDDAKVLVIYGALYDISDDELAKIEDYLDGGGQVIVLRGYTDEDTPNIDSLLLEYGIEVTDGMVIEGDSNYYLPNYPYYLLPEVSYTDYTSDVYSRYILMAFAEGLTEAAEAEADDSDEDSSDEDDADSTDTDESDEEDGDSETDEEDVTLTYLSLLSTTSSSYSKADLTSDTLEMEDGDTAGPFDLGVVVTKTLDDGENEAKLVVFSSETLLDESVDSMVSYGNSALFMNVLSQLVEHESTVSIESKSLEVEYLTVSAGAAIFWSIITVVIVPVAILVSGGVIWYRRRKR